MSMEYLYQTNQQNSNVPLTGLTESVNVYQQLSDIEHVLLRPGMYLGDMSLTKRQVVVYYQNKLFNSEVIHPPALAQLFLEGIGNAADNVWKSRKYNLDPKTIDIFINHEMVSIRNYGRAIPVEKNEQGIWVPQMIFGNLRSGSNYNDDEKRYFIGMNGMGIKLANIFSKEFRLKCGDPERRCTYEQVWNNNMTQCSEPIITPYNGEGYVEISFYPDFNRFGMQGYDEISYCIYKAIAIMISFTCQITVNFTQGYEPSTNLQPVNEQYNIKSIKEYANLFFEVKAGNSIVHSHEDVKTGVSYELCLVDTPNSSISMSFVNGIITAEGGVHVDEAYREIVQKIIEVVGKLAEGVRLTKRDVVDHVSVFLTCRLPNPSFKSQTKEYLTKPSPKISIPENLLKKVKDWELIEEIYRSIELKQNKELKKTDGKRGKKIRDGKIQEANWAGGPNRSQTMGFLVEGLSATGYPTKYISYIKNGNNYYGICPIQGKILNVLEASFSQIIESKQIARVKQFLGLEDNVDYRLESNIKKLKYGRVGIMADADDDGIHITGLLLVLFYTKFPGLIMHGRVGMMMTPVIRSKKGNHKMYFYTRKSFDEWKAITPDWESWSSKEFKGLGSSTDEEIKEDTLHPKYITFMYDEKTAEKIYLAFHKSQADERKEWLISWLESEVLNIEPYEQLPISTYVENLIPYYIIAAIERAIPGGYDGLKEAQRKAIYGGEDAFNKRSKKGKKIEENKVAELAGKILGATNYKHGPTSLMDTIVRMAQYYTGSNNMPYFRAGGQFGSRNSAGKDASSPRYLGVGPIWWHSLIFRSEDKPLLEYVVDEGQDREWKTYYPILPMHLVNGVRGVAMAFATKIPPHNPLDLAFWYQQRLLQSLDPNGGHQLPFIRPWYKGFRGKILLTNNQYLTCGNFFYGENGIIVDELPIGVGAADYEAEMAKLIDKGIIDDITKINDNDQFTFVLHNWKGETPTLQRLRLITRSSYTNMNVIIPNGDKFLVRTYSQLKDIMEDFYQLRIEIYTKRLCYMIKTLESSLPELKEKIRFIATVNEGKLIVIKRIESELEEEMKMMGFDKKLLDVVKTRDYSVQKLNSLMLQLENKEKDIEALKQTKSETLWYREIEEFIVTYSKHEGVDRSSHETCPQPSPKESNDMMELLKQNKSHGEEIDEIPDDTAPIYEVYDN